MVNGGKADDMPSFPKWLENFGLGYEDSELSSEQREKIKATELEAEKARARAERDKFLELDKGRFERVRKRREAKQRKLEHR